MSGSGQYRVGIDQVRDDLPQWTAECVARAASMSVALGADEDDFTTDPLSAFQAWQDYMDSLPLDEFEHSDWVTLKTDVVAYLFCILSRHFSCDWQILPDQTSPRGYRYVVAAPDEHGQVHYLDLFDSVIPELERGQIQLVPMLSDALSRLEIPAILRVLTMSPDDHHSPSP
ncbi:hypothetical protein [Nocardia tengchongensis]